MYRVLIVDDSPTICALLRSILQQDERFEICGMAENGLVAIELAHTLTPDLIVMDINMPLIDGIEATKKIIANYSSFSYDEKSISTASKSAKTAPAIIAFTTEDAADMGFRCLEAGAIEMIRKPEFKDMTESYLKDFCDRLYLITSMHKKIKNEFSTPKSGVILQEPLGSYNVLLIGASTGGPGAVQKVLSGLGEDFPLPVCVTQHIDKNFDKQFVGWLDSTCSLKVKLAEDGEEAKAGTVYVAPADFHLAFKKGLGTKFHMVLNQEESLYFLRPAVDKMFFSAVEVFGKNIMAALLTGMGQDGAKGCKMIVDAGGFTVCEDESTCVVYGMPKAAAAVGGASRVLPLDEIAPFIRSRIMGKI